MAAALAGGGAGAASGGLIGALVGWGIPEKRVKHYETGIKEGGIRLGVKPRSDADATHFEEELKRSGEHTSTNSKCIATAAEKRPLLAGVLSIARQKDA